MTSQVVTCPICRGETKITEQVVLSSGGVDSTLRKRKCTKNGCEHEFKTEQSNRERPL